MVEIKRLVCIFDIILQQGVSNWHGDFPQLRASRPDGLCRSDGPAGQIPVKTTQRHFNLGLITEKRFWVKQGHTLLCLPLPPHVPLRESNYKRAQHPQFRMDHWTSPMFWHCCTSVLHLLAPAWLPVSRNKSGVISRLLVSCPPVAKSGAPSLQLSPRLSPSIP